MKRALLISGIMIILSFTISFGQLSLNKPTDKQIIMNTMKSQPLCFTENRGQWGDKTLFKAEANGATFYFCKDEVAYLFTRNTNEIDQDAMDSRKGALGFPEETVKPIYKKEAMLLKVRFVGANPNPEIVGENRLSYKYNYFYGNNPNKWAIDVPNYSSITYKDIWPGIDLCYHGNGKSMKYDFIVNPGADLSQIQIKYDGVEQIGISNDGSLEARTSFGPVYEKTPYIYQEINGDKREVEGRYKCIGDEVFSFEIDKPFNAAYQLVIDPELIYSTYLGGNGIDEVGNIAVDNAGYVYVAGTTSSTDFIIQNPYQTDRPGFDVFVTKLSPSENNLVFSTYIGGISYDDCNDMVIDNVGNTYLIGTTYSIDFPTLNPYQSSHCDYGVSDAFVIKLAATGDSLLYSTYIGTWSSEFGRCIAIDIYKNAYIAGETSDMGFPTVNPYQTWSPGSYPGNIFVTKLANTGDSLVYSTYLGGTGEDYANDLAVDDSGRAYVTGSTSSSDFPSQNAFQSNLLGVDAFLTKFATIGNSLIYSTYLGGSANDWASSIAVDDSGNAYIAGSTNSSNFPTNNPYDMIYGGGQDAFVSKFSSAGNLLLYSTYLGGSNIDAARGIAIDDSGNAYITGETNSQDFPAVNANDSTLNGEVDAFITNLFSEGDSLIYSTYLGGNGTDFGSVIAVENIGHAFIGGSTYSTDFPIIDPYLTNMDTTDVFIVKFGPPPNFQYLLGDINSDGQRIGGDVTYGVRYFKSIGPQPPDSCFMDSTSTYLYVAGDVNGNCEFRGSDITRLVSFFKGNATLTSCHFFPIAP